MAKKAPNKNDAQISNSVSDLLRRYEDFKQSLERSKDEVRRYENLVFEENELFERKKDDLNLAEIELERARKEEEIAKSMVESEKKRQKEIYDSEEKAKAEFKKRSEKLMRFESELRNVIEHERNLKQSSDRLNSLKEMLDDARSSYAYKKTEAKEDLKKLLKSKANLELTENDLRKARSLIEDEIVEEKKEEVKTDDYKQSQGAKDETTPLEQTKEDSLDVGSSEDGAIPKEIPTKEGFFSRLKDKIIPKKEDDLSEFEDRLKKLKEEE